MDLTRLATLVTKLPYKRSIGVALVVAALGGLWYRVFEIIRDLDDWGELSKTHTVGDIGMAVGFVLGALGGVFAIWLGQVHQKKGTVEPADLSDWIPGHRPDKPGGQP